MTVVAQAADTSELTALLETQPAGAVVLDVRMPPTFTDEGLVAATELKKRFPALGALVLSTYAEGRWPRGCSNRARAASAIR